ncbi:MAG TPA: peptidase M16 [Bacteroidales bacterium]|nr:peptidase M16 [Bacteroidales bacterium]HBZ19811.1 peptidase M16 [Bacteroidales bacterium]
MINFNRFRLDNGLRVIVHEDRSTPLAAMNILYDVGSKDENPGLTGMAHLFEHLMYCGTENIPEYDLPLQLAGGENNAFTNNDITNYYITLPSGNIETAFWLESDRMLEPGFTQTKLDIQRNVVKEEFKQRYLNQPYGDVMLLMRPLSYITHPYRWPTIGMDISHIENVEIEHVKDFFSHHYTPDNAILTLSGNIDPDQVYKLALKWFGSVPERKRAIRNLPPEPAQTLERKLTVERNVPSDALYKAWHIGPRISKDYPSLDLMTDLLAGGESGRLYNKLVRDKNLFSEINAYLTSDIDPGLVIISGKLMNGTDILKAEKAVNEVLNELMDSALTDYELEKVKNRFESSVVLSNTSILNKAMNLSVYELLGDPGMVNREVECYRAVSREMVRESAIKYLSPENCTTLFYLSINKK